MSTVDAVASPGEVGHPRGLAWYALAVLIVATVFGFVDRQILILVVEPLKHDLGMQDLHIGAINGLGPALFAVIAGFPLAWAADKMDRRFLLIGCILFWSAATAACGLAQNFEQLFMATIGIAVGEAVLGPIVYSLIPDLFPGQAKQRANFVYFGAVIMGAGLGLILGGSSLQLIEGLRPLLPDPLRALEGWRLAFFLVALPGIPIALAVLPIRATRTVLAAHASQVASGFAAYFRSFGSTVALIYLAAGLYAFALGATGAWLPVAVMRVSGQSAAEVGVSFGLAYSVGAALGVILAMGTAPVWRRMAGKAHVPRAIAVCTALAIVPTVALLWIATPPVVYVLAGLQIMLVTAGAAFSPTMYQEMAPPQLRARVIAISSVIYASVGALGPMVVGALSDAAGTAPHTLLHVLIAAVVPTLAVSAVLFHLSEKPLVRLTTALSETPTA